MIFFESNVDSEAMENIVQYMGSEKNTWNDSLFKRRSLLRKRRVFKNKKINFSKAQLRSNFHSIIIGASGSSKSVLAHANFMQM